MWSGRTGSSWFVIMSLPLMERILILITCIYWSDYDGYYKPKIPNIWIITIHMYVGTLFYEYSLVSKCDQPNEKVITYLKLHVL